MIGELEPELVTVAPPPWGVADTVKPVVAGTEKVPAVKVAVIWPGTPPGAVLSVGASGTKPGVSAHWMPEAPPLAMLVATVTVSFQNLSICVGEGPPLMQAMPTL